MTTQNRQKLNANETSLVICLRKVDTVIDNHVPLNNKARRQS